MWTIPREGQTEFAGYTDRAVVVAMVKQRDERHRVSKVF